MSFSKLGRRDLLRAFMLTAAGAGLMACAPKVVKETVVVEKEKIVKETVEVEKVVKEAVEVEKEVTRVVEKVVGEEEAPRAPVTITDMPSQVRGSHLPIYKLLVESFQGRNPHIKVEMQFVPDSRAKWPALLAAGTPPDLNTVHDAGREGITPADTWWLNLGPFVDQEDYDLTDFHRPNLDLCYNPFNQNLEALPFQCFVGWLAYHKGIFDAEGVETPPPDWDDTSWTPEKLRETAIFLTRDKNGRRPTESGFDPENIEQYGMTAAGTAFPTLWGWCFGGEGLMLDREDRRNVQIDSEEYIEGLQFYQNLIFKDHCKVRPLQRDELLTGTGKGGSFRTPFHTTRIAMARSTTFHLEAFKALGFEWGIAPMPRHPVTGRRFVRLAANGGAIAKDSAHPEEAWEWLSFLASPEIAEIRVVDMWQACPARKSLGPYFVERMSEVVPAEHLEVVSRAPEFSNPYYWVPGGEWQEVWSAAQQAFLANEKSAREICTESAPIIQAAWDEYYKQYGM